MALPKRKKNKKKLIQPNKMPTAHFLIMKEPAPRFTKETIRHNKAEALGKGVTHEVGVSELWLQGERKSVWAKVMVGAPKPPTLPLELRRRPNKEYVIKYRLLRKRIYRRGRVMMRQWAHRRRRELRTERIGYHLAKLASARYNRLVVYKDLEARRKKIISKYKEGWAHKRAWKLSKLLPTAPGWNTRIKMGSEIKTIGYKNYKPPVQEKIQINNKGHPLLQFKDEVSKINHTFYKPKVIGFYKKKIKPHQKRHWYYVSPDKMRNVCLQKLRKRGSSPKKEVGLLSWLFGWLWKH